MRKLRDHLPEILLLMVSLFLLVLIVSPFAVGFKVQHDYNQLLEQVQKQTGYKPEAIIYNRGWFSSDVRTLFFDKDKKARLILDQNIIHGPLYLGLLLKGQSPWVNMVVNGQLYAHPSNKLLADKLTSGSSITLTAIVDFGSESTIQLNYPGVSYVHDSKKYAVSDISVMLSYQPGSGNLKGETSVADLSIYGDDDIEVHDLKLSFSEALGARKAIGDMVLSIDQLKYRQQSDQLDFYQLSSRLQSSRDGGWIDYKLDINASRVNFLNEQFNSLVLGVNLIKVKSGHPDMIRYIDELSERFDKAAIGMLDEARLAVQPFSFYSDRGRFNAEFDLNVGGKAETFSHISFSDIDIVANMSMTQSLFYSTYESIANYLQLANRNGKDLSRSMLKKGYIRRDNHLYRVQYLKKMSQVDINDRKMDYNTFLDGLISVEK